MTALLLLAVWWVLLHVGFAGTRLRDAAVARIGERGFALLFSLLSVVSIALLARAYGAAPYRPLWGPPPPALGWLLVGAMLPVFVLFAGALLQRNPTAVGGGGLDRPATGLLRVTRHPMLCSFAVWALLHVAGNGHLAALLFFGAFAATALAGMPSIDGKLARRDPEGWRRFAAQTSVLPFAAIAAGRNRVVWREIGWAAPLLGTLLWLLLLRLHPVLFGVSPLPAGG